MLGQKGSFGIGSMVTTGQEREIRNGIDTLKSGGVVAFPTDTLYGLGAAVFIPQAVSRVYEIKGRGKNVPLPLLLASLQQLQTVAVDVPTRVLSLAERFWPGPLTLVVKKSPSVPDLVTGGRPTVAVRIPNHPVALALIDGGGMPITGTSANPSGGQEPITARDVWKLLGDKVDLIIDGGPAQEGVPSTILDVSGNTPSLLRAGALEPQLIEEYLGLRFEMVNK